MKRGDDFDDREFLQTIDLLKTWEDVVPDEKNVRRVEAVVAHKMRSSRKRTSDAVSGLLFPAALLVVALFLAPCAGLLSPSWLQYSAAWQAPGAISLRAVVWRIVPPALMVLTTPLLLVMQIRKAR